MPQNHSVRNIRIVNVIIQADEVDRKSEGSWSQNSQKVFAKIIFWFCTGSGFRIGSYHSAVMIILYYYQVDWHQYPMALSAFCYFNPLADLKPKISF